MRLGGVCYQWLNSDLAAANTGEFSFRVKQSQSNHFGEVKAEVGGACCFPLCLTDHSSLLLRHPLYTCPDNTWGCCSRSPLNPDSQRVDGNTLSEQPVNGDQWHLQNTDQFVPSHGADAWSERTNMSGTGTFTYHLQELVSQFLLAQTNTNVKRKQCYYY